MRNNCYYRRKGKSRQRLKRGKAKAKISNNLNNAAERGKGRFASGLAANALSRRHKLRFESALQANPTILLRYASSFQKVLRYFLEALFFVQITFLFCFLSVMA